MEISGMLIWAMVLVSLIVFIIMLVKAFKSWGVAHTVLLSILFIECWTFLFLAGGVAHYRITLTKNHDKIKEKLEGLIKTVDLEMYGDRADPKLNLEKFVPLTNELNRLILERGRVWREATLQRTTPANGANPATAVFQLRARNANAPADATTGGAAVEGAAPATAATSVDSGLAVNSVVYLFGERPDPLGSIPAVYLGEFVVSEIKDLELKVRPTTPLTKEQETILTDSPTWAIYELMPLDSHIVFAPLGAAPEDDFKFGHMDKEDLAKVLNIDPALADQEPSTLTSISEAIKARVLQSYINDGARAPEQTPPESLSYEVKFLKDYSLGVDAKGGRSPLEGGYHDTEGSMIDERLKRDSDAGVVFKTDDLYVFDAPTAKRLQSEGIVELQGAVFVRPLNDYAFAFREIRRMIIRAKQDIDLVTREYNIAVRSTTDYLKQELKETDEGNKLVLDKAQYQKELSVISSVAEAIADEIKETKSELSLIYRSILQAHDDLLTQHRERKGAVGQ